MMQGNSGSFADDNRINGDGALFIRFAGGETIALFVRFTTQSTTTDNRGNPRYACVLHPRSVLGRFNSLIVDFISLFARFISLFGRVGNLPASVP
jgi:Uncharacterized conserved protein (DUF2278)